MLKHIGPNGVDFIHGDNFFDDILWIRFSFKDFEYDIELFMKVNYCGISLSNDNALMFNLIEI